MEFYNFDENLCYCCLFNTRVQPDYDDAYYYNNYNCTQTDKFHIDFYTHLENFLFNRTTNFSDDLLNIDLIKARTGSCTEKRLIQLLEMIKESSFLELDYKIKLVKCLLCWQCQFNDINLINQIVTFSKESFQTETTSLGDFPNTLMFSIHSHSIEIVKLVLEALGAKLDASVIKYAIIESQSLILKFLLEKSQIKIELIELLIDICVQECKLECLKILLEHSISFDYLFDKSKLVNICKYISLKSLKLSEAKQDLKLDIFKLVFESFKLDITWRIQNFLNSESLFSICFEFTDERVFKYLLNTLYAQEKSEMSLQEILVDTLINKMKRSFECNVNLIEILLNHIKNKRLLYNKLLKYDKGRLIKPCENQLKNFKLYPPADHGYSKLINNSFFIKQQMLIKYDIIPVNKRIFWLANFIYYWSQTNTNRAAYAVSTSTLRFMSIDEIVDLVVNYFSYLITNGFINIRKQSSIVWWFSLKSRAKMGLFNAQDKNRLENQLVNLHEYNKKTPFSLKMIARNRVRYCLASLSNECLDSLNLPSNLVDYLRHDYFN